MKFLTKIHYLTLFYILSFFFKDLLQVLPLVVLLFEHSSLSDIFSGVGHKPNSGNLKETKEKYRYLILYTSVCKITMYLLSLISN